jgi:uncharacterized membrane protein YfhO
MGFGIVSITFILFWVIYGICHLFGWIKKGGDFFDLKENIRDFIGISICVIIASLIGTAIIYLCYWIAYGIGYLACLIMAL